VPELPEVEVVRRGLDQWVAGRTIAEVEVRHPRAVRRHLEGAESFVATLTGRTVTAAHRRGKYLWLPLAEPDGSPLERALVAHLGMSGQLLVERPAEPDEVHLRARFRFTDGGRELRFVDQRTFGGLAVEDTAPGNGDGLPARLAHIAIDPLDPGFDEAAFSAALRRRHTEVKRALLDQTLIGGVGNIYADESLWRARLHGARPTDRLTRPQVSAVLDGVRSVLGEALAQGGTSFDSLYVDVNGQSGYFSRFLAVYGQQDRPCPRCGSPIVRESFMNRSSYSCPTCQPRPRAARATPPRAGRAVPSGMADVADVRARRSAP
jgi:formamidopyrimidine-DNA glycosylase